MDTGTGCAIEALFPAGIPDEAASIPGAVMREPSFLCERFHGVPPRRTRGARRTPFRAKPPGSDNGKPRLPSCPR